jgi:hypothetical protein
MARTLPTVEVVRQFIDDEFDAHTPVRVLRWENEPGQGERIWDLPEGLCVVGAAPKKLGLRIRRVSTDAYAVRLLWDGAQLSWPALSRITLLTSCLAPVLSALGMDLWSLLDQPLPSSRRRPQAA